MILSSKPSNSARVRWCCRSATSAATLGSWKGFRDLFDAGVIDRIPNIVGVQFAGCAPLVKALESGTTRIEPLTAQPTLTTTLMIFNPSISGSAWPASSPAPAPISRKRSNRCRHRHARLRRARNTASIRPHCWRIRIPDPTGADRCASAPSLKQCNRR